MKLLHTLFSRADIHAPLFVAQEYLRQRAKDNAALGDITKLPYVSVTRERKGWLLTGSAQSEPRQYWFASEAEARADILRRFW